MFVPALIAGNAVLYKPSEYATLTGLHIAEMLHEAGVPPDVFVPVIGEGATGAALLRQTIDGVFFTGSYGTGAKIAAAAGRRMIKVQLELGGKDPVYVCDDVDVEGRRGRGRRRRVLQHRPVVLLGRADLRPRGASTTPSSTPSSPRSEGYRSGDPMDESTYLGAITRRAQLDVLKRQVADAKKKGARLLLGGHVVKGRGNRFEATVFSEVDASMLLMRDESFGPIIGIQAVADDDSAIAAMNDTEYGLTAGVYTHDERRARRILSRVRAGTVYWNCCDRVSPRLPWSGVGHSGIGLTLSTYGIQTFTRPKAWHLKG